MSIDLYVHRPDLPDDTVSTLCKEEDYGEWSDARQFGRRITVSINDYRPWADHGLDIKDLDGLTGQQAVNRIRPVLDAWPATSVPIALPRETAWYRDHHSRSVLAEIEAVCRTNPDWIILEES
ncbi:hypothetical protein [Bifidobacterium eulemuris]|uniref:Uncharacterized protein n=1 Tax=Bifidobacterium eulemuris TaxID=1765219 RepID=A0A261G9W8_9BIFI|nr:hypothetical protein [Bifidobacterium eulemuris]OZG68231.1 hypothetical protein BEUL_1244 [Bifidobacterium eulemuris]QOL31712.1 hypothetical protein BE0216_03970 [Bifidobacterium eulemuris]